VSSSLFIRLCRVLQNKPLINNIGLFNVVQEYIFTLFKQIVEIERNVVRKGCVHLFIYLGKNYLVSKPDACVVKQFVQKQNFKQVLFHRPIIQNLVLSFQI
jgi:hypothetical protein